MLWLQHVFFGLMVAVGAASFVLLLRAKDVRAWIWLVVALVGAVGIAGSLSGHATARWRTLALAATFGLFALDALVQYLQSRRKGAPRKIHLGLGLGWLLLGVFQMVDLG